MTDTSHTPQTEMTPERRAESIANPLGLTLDEALAELQSLKGEHLRACKTIAALYEAGTGRKGVGPIRGVIEDVVDERERLLAAPTNTAMGYPVDPFPHLPARVMNGDTGEITMFDMFRQVFDTQSQFQRLLGFEFETMTDADRAEYTKNQVLALLDEAHEALNEVGWKPWASSRHFNTEAFSGELADILCFLINLALVAGLSPDDFYSLHQEKALRNIARQNSKYDGVTGKCPGCARAIDDLKAKGLPIGTFGGVDYCSPECINKVRADQDPTFVGTFTVTSDKDA